jgi:hypothetical protein
MTSMNLFAKYPFTTKTIGQGQPSCPKHGVGQGQGHVEGHLAEMMLCGGVPAPRAEGQQRPTFNKHLALIMHNV